MRSFISELRRRKVHRAAALYAAGGWLLVQVATSVLPLYGVHPVVLQMVVCAIVLGFPVAMVIAWFFQWTPRGWRREIEAGADDSVLATVAETPLPDDASIAVLPFADLSEARDQEYFSDGLAEELLNLLAQLPQLRVIARTSSFSFKGKDADIATIARTLHVAHVLEGSVRKSGNTLRVSAQLIRASDSSHLWSRSFDRELTDVFALQDEIARAVVTALEVKLLPDQQVVNANRTASTAAYEALLIGQNVFRRGRYDDTRRALVAFERAVELDPAYAAAHAALANARAAVADFAASAAARTEGKQAALASAEQAVNLAPQLADGYVVRARLRMALLWDWRGAEADYRRALALEPNRTEVLVGIGLVFNNLQRYDEAIVALRRAIAADPLSWLAWLLCGAALARTGEVGESRKAFARALEISPDSSFAHYELGCLELAQGRTADALANFRQAGAAFSQAGIAMAAHTLGQAAESQAALTELESRYAVGFLFQIAQVHAWRGDRDAAFEWLERAFEQRDAGISRMRGDLLLERIKDDPRYADLVRRVGFPA
jgi:TolB-like protein/Tfp pilus assembly protein PilF